MKKLPFSSWFDLKSVKETKNGNTYAKSSITVSDPATTEEIESCKTWFNVVKNNTQSFSVDSSEHAPSENDTEEVPF
jgi:hypothetical protein